MGRWPADGSWCLCNDYDLPMTFFGGPEAAVDDILADDYIEAFRMEPTTRTDSSGDTLNHGGDKA
jgi:hypothetical protein